MALWMVEHGTRHLTFLSRKGGQKQHELLFIRAIEGAGCTVDVVMGSSTEINDVAQAIKGSRWPIVGVSQLSVVLRDRWLSDMSFEDWNVGTEPKVQGTWNVELAQRIVKHRAFRHGLGLSASVLDVGAVADVGLVAERPDLVNFFKRTSHYFLHEQDVLDALELAMNKSAPSSLTVDNHTFVSDSQIMLAMRLSIPLSSPKNGNAWRLDARLGRYRAAKAEVTGVVRNGGDVPPAVLFFSHIRDEDVGIRRLLAAVQADQVVLEDEAFVD
ncbi:KR domain-containing protein [Xylariomycetidae sp. FL2044]|nr:KR domain-containing protein [Xylariomycetidae sp. FL2044]